MFLLTVFESSSYLPVWVGIACGLIVLAVWRYRVWTAEPANDEFEDLQFSLGAEPAEPDVLALKNLEIAALTERLMDLESLGHRIALMEKRHLAERERLEQELLEASLEAEEKKSYERRWKAIRTRYRNMKARVDELPEGLDEAEGELDGVRKDLERSEKRAESLQKEVERLRQRLKRRDAMVEKGKNRLERALAEVDKLREKTTQQRQENLEAKSELRSLRQDTPRAVDLMRRPKESQPEPETEVEQTQATPARKRASRSKKTSG